MSFATYFKGKCYIGKQRFIFAECRYAVRFSFWFKKFWMAMCFQYCLVLQPEAMFSTYSWVYSFVMRPCGSYFEDLHFSKCSMYVFWIHFFSYGPNLTKDWNPWMEKPIKTNRFFLWIMTAQKEKNLKLYSKIISKKW